MDDESWLREMGIQPGKLPAASAFASHADRGADHLLGGVSLAEHDANRAFWIGVAHNWCKDATFWYHRYESMRRGSLLLVIFLVVETFLLAFFAWGMLSS